MASLTQAQLREELYKALEDAKSMFNDGLVDEKEYGDLKAHELVKYKTAVAALSSATAPPVAHPPKQKPDAPRPVSQPQTPPAQVVRTDVNPAPKRLAPVLSPSLSRRQRPRPSSPPLQPDSALQEGQKEADESISLPDKVSVDPDMYERLRTPPIFRRKGAALRRTVVLNGGESDVQKESLSF